MNIHKGKKNTVNGSTKLYLGDTIYLVVKQHEIGKKKRLITIRFTSLVFEIDRDFYLD